MLNWSDFTPEMKRKLAQTDPELAAALALEEEADRLRKEAELPLEKYQKEVAKLVEEFKAGHFRWEVPSTK